MIAGSYLGALSDRRSLILGTFRNAGPGQTVERPFSPFGQWVRYRDVVRDGGRTVSINGRTVRSDQWSKNSDPWIAIRSVSQAQGGVRDVRILGRPQVLDAVSLSKSAELTGWISYHEEPVLHEKWGWTHVDEPESSGWIVGHANPHVGTTPIDSLLQHQRPLVEDGSIEGMNSFTSRTEFQKHIHALDRLAFILHPSGVREHWIGDVRYDRTNVDPQNLLDVPECRRGPAEIPLNAGDWNQLKLLLRGATVSLELNGQQIYERKLESSNLRTFGLFQFLGRTGVRVRNAVMRGDWPKSLPAVSDQELANDTVAKLDAERARLNAIFSQDLQKDGVPDQYFSPPATGGSVGIVKTPRGVQMTQRATGPHTGFNTYLRFSLCGDFDVEAAFTDLNVECTGDSGIMLDVSVVEDVTHDYRALRMKTKSGNQELQSSLGISRANGGQSFVGSSIPFEATSGRIRLARRGNRIFYLFAEGDSDQFYLFGSESAFSADTAVNGIYLHSFCNGVGLSQVTVTKVVLQAERIKWHSQNPQPTQEFLSVMQADGKGLRTVVAPQAAGFKSVGCPEWSADGRRITFEMSNSSSAASHVFVVNADGTELKDLGLGCTPGFSGDGTKIICSVRGTGVVTMQPDGSDRQVIAAAGWAGQWSPDGRWIAFGEEGNITVLDVNTGKSTRLLKGDTATRYRSIINLGWSHDSRAIAFKAERRDVIREELSLADVENPESFQILHPNAHAVSPHVAFSPDNQQVLVSIKHVARPDMNLYTLDRRQPGPPQLFPVSLPDHQVAGYAWPRDGKSIVIASRFSPNYVEWKTGPILKTRRTVLP